MEKNQVMEIIHKTMGQMQDSLEIGSSSKGGVIKIYGDFNNKEEFKIKVDNAIEVRRYAQEKLL